MVESNYKQMIISIIGVFVLIIAIVGITYAGFSLTAKTGNNSITSGTITMSFQEPSNNVVISNAMPATSSTGYSSTTHFDFAVTGTAKRAMTISYEITATEKSGNTLAASNVRVGLKKNNSTVSGFSSGKLASSLTASSTRSGSKTLYSDSMTLAASGSNYTATNNYQLFLWIDSNATIPNDGTTKYYSITVNVDSTIAALSS